MKISNDVYDAFAPLVKDHELIKGLLFYGMAPRDVARATAYPLSTVYYMTRLVGTGELELVEPSMSFDELKTLARAVKRLDFLKDS